MGRALREVFQAAAWVRKGDKLKVSEIVTEYLKSHGYDGLYDSWGECGCELADLMPCGELHGDCESGHKLP